MRQRPWIRRACAGGRPAPRADRRGGHAERRPRGRRRRSPRTRRRRCTPASSLILIDVEAADGGGAWIDLIAALGATGGAARRCCWPGETFQRSGARADAAAALGRPRSAVHLGRSGARGRRPAGRRAAPCRLAAPAADADGQTHCWTVVGSVGGCGATTIASNWPPRSRRAGPGEPVALVDLNLSDGAPRLSRRLGQHAARRGLRLARTDRRGHARRVRHEDRRRADLLACPRDPRAFEKVGLRPRSAACWRSPARSTTSSS
jgi:hypothetical protein